MLIEGMGKFSVKMLLPEEYIWHSSLRIAEDIIFIFGVIITVFVNIGTVFLNTKN